MKIIEFNDVSEVEMMDARPLKIYIFYCSNSLDIEALRRYYGQPANDLLKTISLPCSGKMELIYLLKSFETGADGAVLITCPEGECRHLEGNLRAHKRAQAVRALLEETGLARERLHVTHFNKEGAVERIASEIKHFCKRIRNYASSKTVPVGSGAVGAAEAAVPKS